MDRVLREPDRSEIDALFARAFDLSAGTVFYPVRHHSPACAYHLRETIRLYQPDKILIEGPSDVQSLLPHLADEGSVPPLCIYYSYDDREGRVSEDKEKYRAYYPFLSYSPEWVAIREAFGRGIEAMFIDLPYAAGLVNRPETAQAQYSYNEDQEYEANRYTALLSQKSGCRSFSEFWDSRFELEVQTLSTPDFVRAVFSLGYFMRLSTPADEEDLRPDLWREWYMSQKIREAAQTCSRVLVVTGAFHVAGLLKQLAHETPYSLKRHNPQDMSAYLMPYTFQEADSKSGYAAGLPFPAFYQRLWENLGKKKRPFEATILEYIVKTARYARNTQPVSLPDEINAYAMAQSLASLRGKSAPGVYELVDGVRSAFVKGDLNSTATFELDFLLRMLTGMGAGLVTAKGCVPPVVQEFRALCAKYRLKSGTVARQEVTLDIVKNPAHYAKSRFLHQLRFLETGFCKMMSGPDYVEGRDRNLVREIWVCRYSVQVETRLTDLSVYGATLSQVCAALVEKEFQDSMTAQALGKLLISIQVMGVEGFYGTYGHRINEVVEGDRNFESLCTLIGSLRYLATLQQAMDGQTAPEVPALIRKAFQGAVDQMPSARSATEEEEQSVCEKLRTLYGLTVEQPDWCDPAAFAAQTEKALEDGFCNSRFYGACLAIRGKQGALSQEQFCGRITAYLETSLCQPEQAASFICGLFLIARDVIFTDSGILDQLDRLVSGLDSEQFLAVLPNLRYAFTSFLPAELDRLGCTIAQRHHAGSEKLSGSMEFTQAEMELALAMDARAAKQLERWGL